jgi:hypothetical protein
LRFFGLKIYHLATLDRGAQQSWQQQWFLFSSPPKAQWEKVRRLARRHLVPGLTDFSRYNIPNPGKIYKMTTKCPNAHKIHLMVVICY